MAGTFGMFTAAGNAAVAAQVDQLVAKLRQEPADALQVVRLVQGLQHRVGNEAHDSEVRWAIHRHLDQAGVADWDELYEAWRDKSHD